MLIESPLLLFGIRDDMFQNLLVMAMAQQMTTNLKIITFCNIYRQVKDKFYQDTL